ncbi:hypothetical protein Bca52824_027996 [Brassica carinata]|uniref:Uncharacterized protein n=1 Tax=Brassica carinata TaxID=52824 RepID=A0A8X7VBJ4_BRACI|nr:hypothetical protein Bca52824_027996 [Brassica carinata]
MVAKHLLNGFALIFGTFKRDCFYENLTKCGCNNGDTDEAWIYGDVVEANDEEINVNCQTKTVVAKVNDVYPKDPQFLDSGVNDMTKLACLHDLGFFLVLSPCTMQTKYM